MRDKNGVWWGSARERPAASGSARIHHGLVVVGSLAVAVDSGYGERRDTVASEVMQAT